MEVRSEPRVVSSRSTPASAPGLRCFLAGSRAKGRLLAVEAFLYEKYLRRKYASFNVTKVTFFERTSFLCCFIATFIYTFALRL